MVSLIMIRYLTMEACLCVRILAPSIIINIPQIITTINLIHADARLLLAAQLSRHAHKLCNDHGSGQRLIVDKKNGNTCIS